VGAAHTISLIRWGEATKSAASQPSEIDMTKSNEMTFTPAALKQVLDAAIAEAVAAALGKAAAQGSAPKNTIVDGRTEASLKIDIAVVKAFKRAGYGDVTPREDTRTYNKWLSEGYKVRSGEKATKVKQFHLFHKSQVEFVGIPPKETAPTEAEVATVKAAKDAAKPNGKGRGKASAVQATLPV
jgi:uncharacterized protein (DUF4415 family)